MKKLVTVLSLMAFIFIGCPEPAEPAIYTVTFNTDGGSTIQSQTVESGQKATKPEPDPTLENNVFGGWYKDVALKNEYDFDTAVTGNTPLYAKWIKVEMVDVTGGTVDGTEMQDGVFKGRKVTLSNFEIGKHEVTQELYEAVMTGNTEGISAEPSEFKGSPATDEVQEKRPVEQVNWYDAVYFCNALSENLGLTKAYTITGITVTNGSISSATVGLVEGATTGYRLPTEAEWEYAARGGDPKAVAWNYEYAGGDDLDNVAWYDNSDNSDLMTHEVGKKNPISDSLEIYDMSGNVWEWCWDRYNKDPKAGDPAGTSPVEDPTGPTSGSDRVSRGGSWGSNASNCSVSHRNYHGPYARGIFRGFRVVRPAGTAEQSQ